MITEKAVRNNYKISRQTKNKKEKGLIITDSGMMNSLPKIYNETMIGGLNNLLEADSEAREYYLGLPKETRDMLFIKQDQINSFDALRKAADGDLR